MLESKRVVALLLTLKYGRFPWFQPNQECDIKGAAQCGPDRWILCFGHVYTDAEIDALLHAGIVTIADKLDRFGRFTLAPGPALDEALKAAPTFSWTDWYIYDHEIPPDEKKSDKRQIDDDQEITDDDIPF
jgi:hypothetical protein